jgi:molybdopterin-biosynthesis enzyme MoeA-like protein
MSNVFGGELPKIGLLVVGDEILSGLRQDKHVAAVIERLAQRGLSLSWVSIVGDDRAFLVETLKRSFASNHLVLSCGGIGGTPDDHTRQAAAIALGRPIVRHPQAAEFIRQRCEESQQPADEYRLRMADFPDNAELIPNPYNRIAGFSVERHHFFPGFPEMAWPMIEWVLDVKYAHWHYQGVELKKALRLYQTLEAEITPVMEALEARYPHCTLYSLPSVGDEKTASFIELGIKVKTSAEAKKELDEAFGMLLRLLQQKGKPIELL